MNNRSVGRLILLFSAALLCVVALAFSCGSGTASSGLAAGSEPPSAVKGLVDLGSWSFEDDGALNLKGQWEFCRDRILAPADFAGNASRSGCGYLPVPGLWKGHGIGGVPLTGRGRGTYRLRIQAGAVAGRQILTLPRIYSAYRLWINGVPADAAGTIEEAPRTRDDYVFINSRRTSFFTLKKGENELLLQVWNRDYESGGIGVAPSIEEGAAVMRRIHRRHTVDMIIVGLLLFASMYNILLYFFRSENKAPLYIGLFSLVFAVNTYNLQSPVLSGDLSYPGNPLLLDYSTVVLGMTLCIMTMKSLFPEEFSTAVLRVYQVLAVVFITPLFFVGFRASERIIGIFFIFCILFILYGLYVFIRIWRNRREDAVLFIAGFSPLVVGAINNILYALWIIDTGNIIHFSTVLFCLIITLIISRRFARALGRVEELSRDLEEKNQSLTKLDRLKDQFLASTSHELRTPLHGMIGLSESMIDGAAGWLPPKALENLSLISSSGHRLAGMVNDLLDMAKMQEEGLSLNLRPVDLHPLGESVVRLSIPLAGGKPLKIVNGIGTETPRVWADEERIRQVLFNLVGNAVKFTNAGRVELSARVMHGGDDNGGSVEVRVSDTGIGVPEEYRETIFEAYRQAEGGDTRAYPGTGLGLSIARRIVELHGGTIGVDPREGGGSVFHFTLPVPDGFSDVTLGETVIQGKVDDAVSADHSGGDDGLFEGTPVILVVDDDPVNLDLLRNCLQSGGGTVKTAPDGVTALEILEREGPVDLVLLDVMMPDMSGYEVCRRIRAGRSPKELPVVMLTAKNRKTDIDAAFVAGANDYIVKPFIMREVLARVGMMLKLGNVQRPAPAGITVRIGKRARSIRFGEIVHITAQSKHTVIHTVDGDTDVPVLMKDIVYRLPPDLFIRVHRSHIVNIDFIRGISRQPTGRYRVRLGDGGTELPVGQAFLEALREKMQ
ncbi:MAG: response regulator [Spirochaetes bacterium]|nr:response regulator [Spirochaetota bacterium]